MDRIFNKNNIEFVLSGSCALITVLKSSLEKDSKVIIPNNVCARVLEAVILSGMIPIIISPKNGLTLENEDIELVKKNIDFDAIIIVHNYCVESDTKEIRLNNPNKIIIEDCAQYWKKDSYVGLYSDYVITSVDTNKLLKGRHFGMILFNDEKIFLDKGVKTRYEDYVGNPFALTVLPKKQYLYNIFIKATKLNIKINKLKSLLDNVLRNYEDIIYIKGECNNLKCPIIFKKKNDYEKFMKIADERKFCYSEPHEKLLEKLPMLKELKFYFYEHIESYMKNQIYLKMNLITKQDIKVLDDILKEVFYGND